MQYYDLRSALYRETGLGQMTNASECVASILLVIKNLFYRIDTGKFADFSLENIVSSEDGLTFTWVSNTEEAICHRCGATSKKKRHTYKMRTVIDEPVLGMAVTHSIRTNVYLCDVCAEAGGSKSFVEPISSICRGSHIKTTINLDERIVNDAVYRSANSLAGNYAGSIDLSAGTILNRLKEAGGIVTERNLAGTEGVKVLSVDDNNGRKGSPATASTVVVDIERHVILVVAQGADSVTAKKIFERFPDAETLSRDRACAYAKAGEECGLEQVADLFHLVMNAHEAVKEAITRGMDYNIYIKEGEGWVDITAAGALPAAAAVPDSVTAGTLSDEDMALRVRLASLSPRQEKKCRQVIGLLRLQDPGLGLKEINARLGITQAVRIGLYRDAADVVNDVEERIDEYYARLGQGIFRQRFMPANPRPSSESIVEPYSDTVMMMAGEGKSHRETHPVIKEMGFAGSANAVYQYLLKRSMEEGEAIIAGAVTDTSLPEGVPQRPPRVSLQRVTRTAMYRFVLHEASEKRAASPEKAPVGEADTGSRRQETATPAKNAGAFYSEMVTEIIRGRGKEPSGKKKAKPDYQAIADKNPIVYQSVEFLRDLHGFVDDASVGGMEAFIAKCTGCGIAPFERYARGIKADKDSVENAILNRDVNNGQMEGFNNKIKFLRKVRYGRSKGELLNAFSVLSTLPRFRYLDHLVPKLETMGNRRVKYYGMAA